MVMNGGEWWKMVENGDEWWRIVSVVLDDAVGLDGVGHVISYKCSTDNDTATIFMFNKTPSLGYF